MERLFRTIYFCVVPFVLVAASIVFPMTGVLINVALSTIVFLLAERMEGVYIGKVPLTKVFGKQLKFRTYYQENPPRSFWYYVAYPIILPYILFNKKARQEFLLYRGYALFNLVLLIGANTVQYFRFWYPGISFKAFVPIVIAGLVLEALLVSMFVVPMSTTIIAYKLQGKDAELKRLFKFAVVSLAIGLLGVWGLRTKKPLWVVTERTHLRVKEHPEEATATKKAALQKAQTLLAQNPKDILADGFVVGTTIDEVRKSMEGFFLPDETKVFYLWVYPPKNPTTIVIYPAHAGTIGPWLGLSTSGQWLTKEEELPKDALFLMEKALK
jgi:hypothetical protein